MNLLTMFSKRLGKGGFSLTEVMVGGAILAGVGLAAAQLFKDQKSAQSKIEGERRLANFHTNLVKLLKDAKNCNATFSNSAGAAYTALQPITGIYLCNNCTDVNIKYEAANSPRQATPFMAAGRWIENTGTSTNLGTRTWRVAASNGFTLITPGSSRTGNVILRVAYEYNPDLKGGVTRRIQKDVNLVFRFDSAGRFRECVSAEESNVSNLQSDICSALAPITSTGSVIMEWNDDLQKCVLRGTSVSSNPAPVKDCASVSTSIGGIGQDGSVHCEDILDGRLGPAIINTSSSCTGKRARLIVNGDRVEFLCF